MERIRKLDGENIIVVTNNVKITPELVEENRATCRQLMSEMEGTVTIIINYTGAKTSFMDILQILKGNRAGKRKDLNQRAFTIFVGEDKYIHMYRDTMSSESFGGMSVPYLSDMDEALEVARVHLAGKNTQTAT